VSFAPSAWRALAVVVVGLAVSAGGLGSVIWAPVGNLVDLRVRVGGPGAAQDVARAAVEAQLVAQLRALKLDVGGPADGRVPGIRVEAVVWPGGPPPLADAVSVRVDLAVRVAGGAEEGSGGHASVEAVGTGPTPWRAEAEAGTVAGGLASGEVARLVSRAVSGTRTLRQLTDGRGTVRVFAAVRERTLGERADRLVRVVEAQTPPGDSSLPLTLPGEDARLAAPLNDREALVVVSSRHVAVLPTARESPRLLPAWERLEVRGGEAPRLVAVAHAFLGTAAVDVLGAWAAAGVREVDGAAALCVFALAGGENRCLPLGDRAVVRAVSVSPGGGAVVAEVASCGRRCPVTRLSWDVAAGVTRGLDVPGSRPGWLANASATPATTTPRVEAAPGPLVPSPSGGAGFFQVDFPDPDLPEPWGQVRRVTLEDRGVVL
jgi:hypothetical protein